MRKEFGPIFWIHILLLIPGYLSPILFDWRLIILGALALQIQYWLIGGCILTHIEMGKDKDETFVWYYLRKIFPNISRKRTNCAIRFVSPAVLILIAIILQTALHFKPLVLHF